MPLFRADPQGVNPFRLSIEAREESDNKSDPEAIGEVNSAFGYEIRISNRGNQVVELPHVAVSIDSPARLIQFGTYPNSSPGYSIEYNVLENGIMDVLLPYINPKQEIYVRFLTINNSSRDCTVNIYGKGVISKSAKKRIGLIPLLVNFGLIIFMVLIDLIPSRFLANFGFTSVIARRNVFPFPLLIGILILSAWCMFDYYRNFTHYNRLRQREECLRTEHML